MLSHKDVWHGIDQLAARNGFSASGLARRAGLDPTTFNKSKRTTGEGKPRWPSTESLSKILEATKTSMEDFVALMHDQPGTKPAGGQRLRSISWTGLAGQGVLDASGFPQGDAWEEMEVPLTDDRQAFAIELDQDVVPPVYRSGDMLIVSPSSSIRRGDRVLIARKNGTFDIGILLRRTAQRVALANFQGEPGDRGLPVADIAWMARVIWVSQ